MHIRRCTSEGAEGAAAAAGTPPVRMMSSHGLALSNSLRFLRGQLREFLRECAGPQTSRSLCTTRAKAGCIPLSSGPCTSSSGCARACERGGPYRHTGRSPQALGCGLLGVGIRFSFGWLPGICLHGMDCWELLLVD